MSSPRARLKTPPPLVVTPRRASCKPPVADPLPFRQLHPLTPPVKGVIAVWGGGGGGGGTNIYNIRAASPAPPRMLSCPNCKQFYPDLGQHLRTSVCGLQRPGQHKGLQVDSCGGASADSGPDESGSLFECKFARRVHTAFNEMHHEKFIESAHCDAWNAVVVGWMKLVEGEVRTSAPPCFASDLFGSSGACRGKAFCS